MSATRYDKRPTAVASLHTYDCCGESLHGLKFFLQGSAQTSYVDMMHLRPLLDEKQH